MLEEVHQMLEEVHQMLEEVHQMLEEVHQMLAEVHQMLVVRQRAVADLHLPRSTPMAVRVGLGERQLPAAQ